MQFLKKLENFRKHKDIKHITTERRRYYLVSNQIVILQSFS